MFVPRSRIASLISRCGRITVNLAPADLPKESGRFDLPIALGIIIASGQLKAIDLDQYEFAGELSAVGRVAPDTRRVGDVCARRQTESCIHTAHRERRRSGAGG